MIISIGMPGRERERDSFISGNRAIRQQRMQRIARGDVDDVQQDPRIDSL